MNFTKIIDGFLPVIESSDHLENQIIPVGGSVDLPITAFQSAEIGVGIQFTEAVKFAILYYARSNSNITLGAADSIVRNDVIKQTDYGVVKARTEKGIIRVTNLDTKDIIVNCLTFTRINSVNKVTSAGSGRMTTGIVNVPISGTRVQLPNIPCEEVTIIAKKKNTGSIFAGDKFTTVTNYGAELEAKESYTFKVSNASLIYIDASISAEGVSYVAL